MRRDVDPQHAEPVLNQTGGGGGGCVLTSVGSVSCAFLTSACVALRTVCACLNCKHVHGLCLGWPALHAGLMLGGARDPRPDRVCLVTREA